MDQLDRFLIRKIFNRSGLKILDPGIYLIKLILGKMSVGHNGASKYRFFLDIFYFWSLLKKNFSRVNMIFILEIKSLSYELLKSIYLKKCLFGNLYGDKVK